MPLCKGEYALLPGSPLGVSRLEFSRIAGVVAGRDDLAYLKGVRQLVKGSAGDFESGAAGRPSQ